MEVKEEDCGKCGYVCLLTVCRLAAAIAGGILLTYWCFGTLPIALMMCVHLNGLYVSGSSKDSANITYLFMILVYNTVWIIAFREYDSR